MEILTTFTVPVSLCLDELQRDKAREVLNLHYFNDKEINKLVDGKMIGKYDDHPRFKELQDAHYTLCGHKRAKIKIGLTTSGTFEILDCK